MAASACAAWGIASHEKLWDQQLLQAVVLQAPEARELWAYTQHLQLGFQSLHFSAVVWASIAPVESIQMSPRLNTSYEPSIHQGPCAAVGQTQYEECRGCKGELSVWSYSPIPLHGPAGALGRSMNLDEA